jgi:hypothetical protein
MRASSLSQLIAPAEVFFDNTSRSSVIQIGIKYLLRVNDGIRGMEDFGAIVIRVTGKSLGFPNRGEIVMRTFQPTTPQMNPDICQ